jgi:hypothetical protein
VGTAILSFNSKRRIIGKYCPDTNHHGVSARFKPVNTAKVLDPGYFHLPALAGGELTVGTHCNIDYDIGSHVVPLVSLPVISNHCPGCQLSINPFGILISVRRIGEEQNKNNHTSPIHFSGKKSAA